MAWVKALQRDDAAVVGVNVGGLEGVRVAQKLRGSLQNHVVLVERGVNGRDLRLAKTEVQGIINELRSDAEARRDWPVVVKQHLHAAVLLVGGHVLELRHLQHFVVDARSPGAEVFDRIGRELVLVCALLCRPPTPRSCEACRKVEAPVSFSSLGRRRSTTAPALMPALLERLEVNKT